MMIMKNVMMRRGMTLVMSLTAVRMVIMMTRFTGMMIVKTTIMKMIMIISDANNDDDNQSKGGITDIVEEKSLFVEECG